jgi:hypothetical protein
MQQWDFEFEPQSKISKDYDTLNASFAHEHWLAVASNSFLYLGCKNFLPRNGVRQAKIFSSQKAAAVNDSFIIYSSQLLPDEKKRSFY